MEIPRLHILRFAKDQNSIFGTITDYNGIPFAVSLENAGLAIPMDLYEAEHTIYHKHNYETFEILVPGRTRILLHRLNVWQESEGCIGIAEKFTYIDKVPGIGESEEGFTEFMQKYGKFPKIYVEISEFFVHNEEVKNVQTISTQSLG